MKRRTFLKGLAGVAAVAIAPSIMSIATVPKPRPAQTFASWTLIERDRNVRDMTDIYLLRRGDDICELAFPWYDQLTDKAVLKWAKELYP